MSRTYLRGDMYYADLGKCVGSEQEGYRPVVIIQNDIGNHYSPTVVIAAITSKMDIKPKLPTHYFINAESGLKLPPVILLEQLRTIDKHRLDKYIGHLKKKHIEGMNNALAISIDMIQNTPHSLLICLCKTCAENLYRTNTFYLRKAHFQQMSKDICSCCNSRMGFNYEIIKMNMEVKK